MHDACLVVENGKGRDALLARAESFLPATECLVKITDVIGLRRAVRTVPTDPRAQLVAREIPLVMRGGLTTLVTYWRVPVVALGAHETHSVGGVESHGYDVLLSVATRGRATSRKSVVA